MLCDVLIILLYIRATDLYVSNNLMFRAFHCTSLTFLSLRNTIYYGTSIVNCSSSIQKLHSIEPSHSLLSLSTTYFSEDFYLKIIPIYFILYIVYDLKNCTKRIDLLFHHVVCVSWALLNFKHNVGFISFTIFSEGVTFAYIIKAFKNQLIYRLLFTTIFRFPVWTVLLYRQHTTYVPGYDFLYFFNNIIATTMILMDCVWFTQNVNKLQKIMKNKDY
jgi:hypothetical protein